jgi:hypothetical protein
MHRPQKRAVKLWLPKDSDKTDTRSELSACTRLPWHLLPQLLSVNFLRLHVGSVWEKAKEKQEAA